MEDTSLSCECWLHTRGSECENRGSVWHSHAYTYYYHHRKGTEESEFPLYWQTEIQPQIYCEAKLKCKCGFVLVGGTIMACCCVSHKCALVSDFRIFLFST